MNGSQDVRQSYPDNQSAYGAGRPPDAPAGGAPPVWRQNVQDVGVPASLATDPRRKSPVLAAILSAMPGLGQVYVGYYQQGFINIMVVSLVIVMIANARYGSLVSNILPLLGLFLAFFWLYNIVDAARRAMFYNQSLAGLGAVDIPEDMKLPKGQGSLAGGVVLIGLGLLLFANTALGMSLEWLERWWPMALVLAGGYLVYLNFQSRK